MKYPILKSLLLFSFFGTLTLQAQTENKGLLWEISGNGLTEKSYLFGTIHLVPEKEFFLPQLLVEKLTSCKTLATEIELDIPMMKQISMAKSMLMPQDVEMKSLMDSVAWNKLQQYCRDSINLSDKKIGQYFRLKPYFAASMLLKEKLGDIKSYDKEIESLAKKNKITNIGLEKLEDQLALFDSIPLKEQAKELVKENTTLYIEYRKVFNMYKSGNVDLMANTAMEEVDGKKMLVNRNNKWMPVIKQQISKQPTFIAVGAAHLGGEIGIINQLRKAGYKVESIN